MMLLLDQGLPRYTALHLRHLGIPSTHAADAGLATASDATILDFGRERGWVIVTLDADFHAHLALSGAAGPSVIRIRIEGLRAEGLATLLSSVIEACSSDLAQGA